MFLYLLSFVLSPSLASFTVSSGVGCSVCNFCKRTGSIFIVPIVNYVCYVLKLNVALVNTIDKLSAQTTTKICPFIMTLNMIRIVYAE